MALCCIFKRVEGMKKYLITGIGGFVGRYFWAYLREKNPDCRVFGIDMMPEAPWKHAFFQYRQLNLMDASALCGVVEEFQPDAVVHLASMSSVGQSWKTPADCFINNTGIFLNLIEAVRNFCPEARVLSVGSSEEYGDYPVQAMPLREDHELRPGSPYAVARVAQEMFSRVYAQSYGLKILMTRSFNHMGPQQRDTFVVPSFVRQLVEIKKKGAAGMLHVGNIDVVRDFLDVRDVVDAYGRILEQGSPGEIYNVCSGEGVSLRTIIQRLADLLDVDVEIIVEPTLLRPADNLYIVGDNTKLRQELGWERRYPLERSLREMIDFWGKR